MFFKIIYFSGAKVSQMTLEEDYQEEIKRWHKLSSKGRLMLDGQRIL